MEVGSWKLEVGSWKMEVGSWKLEVGNWKLEVGSWKLEVGTHDTALETTTVANEWCLPSAQVNQHSLSSDPGTCPEYLLDFSEASAAVPCEQFKH
ncbi:conserved hypothetical protein [Culex quinquefasciatus]|uniref:Phosphotransferase n=1 Tax=Culex quinquefasciatus TaxID=7176 RepID=B0WW51_CULQU|nr:conserved hypothetical protein [Culex quinquefasciatus]|eukprot:XP_001861623.1 conserved hypothetical protein [Culex quinquefasciatus]